MTLEEAEKILDKCNAYIDWRGDYAILDGDFTLEQIEAVVIVARAEMGKGPDHG